MAQLEVTRVGTSLGDVTRVLVPVPGRSDRLDVVCRGVFRRAESYLEHSASCEDASAILGMSTFVPIGPEQLEDVDAAQVKLHPRLFSCRGRSCCVSSMVRAYSSFSGRQYQPRRQGPHLLYYVRQESTFNRNDFSISKNAGNWWFRCVGASNG